MKIIYKQILDKFKIIKISKAKKFIGLSIISVKCF